MSLPFVKVEAKLRTLVERNEVRHLLIPRFGDVLSKAIVEIYWSSTDNESWPDEGMQRPFCSRL